MNPAVIIKKLASVLKMLGLSKVIVAVFLLLVAVLTFLFLVIRASKKRQAEAAKDLQPSQPSNEQMINRIQIPYCGFPGQSNPVW